MEFKTLSDIQAKEIDPIVANTGPIGIPAKFYLLKRGYKRPTTIVINPPLQYIRVGVGSLVSEKTIYYDVTRVLNNIAEAPDISTYIQKDERVEWYVIKKVTDGWHVDGEIIKKIGVDVAALVVSEMGVGWNLGNTLDAYSRDPYSSDYVQQKRDKYQLMAMYSTKTTSGWDASPAPYFSSSNSSCDLNWKITKLNSALNQACGKFSFQIFNNALEDSGENILNFTVTKAQFTTAKGVSIILSDLLGDYSITIKNNVTSYVLSDLTKISQLATTADLLGGSLIISIKIIKYPLPKIASNISKETYYETLWGNPITTKAMIDMVKQAGFGAIRIPITYYNHMDAAGNIDLAWLARVKEVVQYVTTNGMYCIINLHHDTGTKGWLKADLSSINTTGTKFKSVWNQIAQYFKDYNQNLLFEGYNELLNNSNQWSSAGADSYAAANQLNQIFLDTVRSTGSNNSERCLIVNTYAANTAEEVVKSFVLPKDTLQKHLIVEVHYYNPSQQGISAIIERMNALFVSKGVPVIIGEFATAFSMAEVDRIAYANSLVTSAKHYNITVFWWDDGNYANKAGAQCNYAILDKCALSWYHPAIAQALVISSKIEQ